MFSIEEQRLILLALMATLVASAIRLFGPVEQPRVTPRTRPVARAPVVSPPRPGGKADPNEASPAELLRVPGMSARIAERIVRFRRDHVLLSPEDLGQIDGVTPRELEVVVQGLAFPGAAHRSVLSTSERLDVNLASERDLAAVPGIGPERAHSIAERRQRRPYVDVEELLDLPGITPGKLEYLQGMLRAGPRGGHSSARAASAPGTPPVTARGND